MLEVLRIHHERMRLCLVVHRDLCREDAPQCGRLALSRLRITASAAERSRFLAKEVLPILQESSQPNVDRIIDQLAADLKIRQAAAKSHIDQWELAAIERDWPGYQSASRRVMAGIEQRLKMESDLLEPILLTLTGLDDRLTD